MLGEHCVVAAAGDLLVVPDKVMVELFSARRFTGFMRLPGFRVGDTVTIRHDPFSGLIGELVQVGGREAKIWVDALSATVRIGLREIELLPAPPGGVISAAGLERGSPRNQDRSRGTGCRALQTSGANAPVS